MWGCWQKALARPARYFPIPRGHWADYSLHQLLRQFGIDQHTCAEEI